MVRLKPKLPFASVAGKPKLRISGADWQRIETAYGHPLSKSVRGKIRCVTREFLDWVAFEPAARSNSEALARVQSIKKAVHEFREVIFRYPPSMGRDADLYARRLICKHVGLPFEGRDGLQNLALKLSKGCDLAQADLTRGTESGFRQGDAWDLWVRKLTSTLKSCGLPTGARGDYDPTKEESPFVRFIDELQKSGPIKFRRVTNSRAALAKAIQRARGTQKPRGQA
jgi:hypothetical protein